MSAISELYIKTQVAAALLEVFDMELDDMCADTPQRLIEALDDRDIDLVPR